MPSPNAQQGAAKKVSVDFDFICTSNSENVKQYTLPQAASRQGFYGCAEAQLSTHYRGRQKAPVVITYGSPLSVFQHLHSALAYIGPTSKTNQRLLERKNGDIVRRSCDTFIFKTTYLAYSGSFKNNRLSWMFGTSTFPSLPWESRAADWWLHVYKICY